VGVRSSNVRGVAAAAAALESAGAAAPLPPSTPDLEDGYAVTVLWRNEPYAGGGSGAPAVLRSEFMYLNPGSAAAELWARSAGLDSWKAMEGGWLYLVGERSLFWSLALGHQRSGAAAAARASGPQLGRRHRVVTRACARSKRGTRRGPA
jgi:hypothetical protein